MSKFATYLKELLDARGEPIASVARGSGVERTSIHKALKDERTLSYMALRSLAQYLQLSLPQVRELNERYEMLIQGEEAYLVQGAICDTLLDLARLHVSTEETTQLPSGPGTELAEGVVTGSVRVRSVLREILARGAGESGTRGEKNGAHGEKNGERLAEVLLYLPSEGAPTDALLSLWRDAPEDLRVRQLVNLVPDRTDREARVRNLEVVRQLLQLSLMSRGRFFCYGFYGVAEEACSVEPLPYFVVSGEWLVRLDAKLTVAHVTRDRALVRLYRESLERVQRECRPLNTYSDDVLGTLEAYMSATDEDGYYTIMTQPCLGHYYTREVIEEHVRPEVPMHDVVVDVADRRFERLRALRRSYYTVFTEEGLRQFADDGVLVDFPSQMVRHMSRDRRLQILRDFRDDVASGEVTGLVTDPTALSVPPYLTITADPHHGLHVYATEGYARGAYTCNLHIDESGIGQSFCQFIRSLPGSRYVYAHERTLELLDDVVAGLEARAGEGA